VRGQELFVALDAERIPLAFIPNSGRRVSLNFNHAVTRAALPAPSRVIRRCRCSSVRPSVCLSALVCIPISFAGVDPLAD